jgi:hypothetical protein
VRFPLGASIFYCIVTDNITILFSKKHKGSDAGNMSFGPLIKKKKKKKKQESRARCITSKIENTKKLYTMENFTG